MSLTKPYRIKTPEVAHETIDGEAVIVNLESGYYYSLRDAGAEIWNLIDRGANTLQVKEQICQQYSGDAKVIGNTLQQFIEILEGENLIEPAPDSTETFNASSVPGSVGEKSAFQMPVLEKYDDMQQLLLLDPIHETDEEGWPHQLEDLAES
jgi:hypothetical protein